MHESNISLLRDEAQRLLNEGINLLSKIQDEPNVLVEQSENAQTLDLKSLPKAIEQLQGERLKLKNLDLVLAVVGTMKAGKSTTINAIVGLEVLPNRNRPMTAVPTLIRHTPGVTEPRLLFSNTAPVNQLMRELAKKLPKASAELINELNLNDDMKELLSRIKSKQSFVEEHNGAEAIFSFLKGLNDLVRLSKVLNVDFPFSAYSRIENLPLIEVEFTHLSQMGHTQGRLTLLDTPGPNEAGQEHLRPMLRDQLKKASAVLAVLDYTQLKSDADHEMRENLEEVARVTGDRLYALVNRFDQKDRNSDSSEDVRKYVSSTLMKGLISPERVFPVSARLGYLASQAKNELALHKKLPPYETNAWVADFAQYGLGLRWKSMLDNTAAVSEVADDLWRESLFSAPLNSVICEAYAKAPILAVDSSATKMVDLAENAKNFLGTRKQAFKKSVEEIQHQIASLQSDIAKIQQLEVGVQEDVKLALADVREGINEAGESIKGEIFSDIDGYFSSGKAVKSSRKKRSSLLGRIAESLTGGSNKIEESESKDFESIDKPGRFENKEEALELLGKIDKSISSLLKGTEDDLQEKIKDKVNKFNKKFNRYVGDAQSIIKKIKHGMHDFDLIVRVPNAQEIQLNFNISEVLSDATQEKIEKETRYRRQSGIWGGICDMFGTDDWGWEKYSVDVDVFYVDVKQIKEVVNKSISDAFDDMKEAVGVKVEAQLKEQTDMFFSVLCEKVERIRGDLITSMNDRRKTQVEQVDLLGSLTRLEKPLPKLLRDAEELAQDVKKLLSDAEVAQ